MSDPSAPTTGPPIGLRVFDLARVLTVVDCGTTVARLAFAGSTTKASFNLISDNDHGTFITHT